MRNFRCFEEFCINLKEDYTVIVGINGAGKTTILDAISIALGSYISAFDGIYSNGILSHDAYYKYHELGNRIDPQSQFPVIIDAIMNVEGNYMELERRLNKKGGKTTVSGTVEIRKYAKCLQDRIMEGDKNLILPIISYYGTGRLWMQKNQKKTKKTNIMFARQTGYVDCLASASSEKSMLKWFEEMTYIELQEGKKVEELESVKKALKRCYINVDKDIKDVNFIFNVKSHDLEIKIERLNGQKEILPIKLLSDGIKGVLGMVADISYRMALLNPQLLDKSNNTPGIVLIDEVDMHLHPSWQMRIIDDLRAIFPNVQFIFTTHSPSIISNVPKENILILDNREVYEPSNTTYGRDITSILREIMNVEVRPKKVVDMIKKFNKLIEDGKIEEAREVLNKLELILGSDDSDVVGARITLALEEI